MESCFWYGAKRQGVDRGARMVADSGRPIAHVARDLGIHHESLRKWVRQAEADIGKRKPTSDVVGPAQFAHLTAQGLQLLALGAAQQLLCLFAAELDPLRTK